MGALRKSRTDTADLLGNLAIMIVDDVTNMRTLVRTILQHLGVNKIVEAQHGEEALEISESRPFDLILSDWNMAPMDGVAFIRSLRRRTENPNCRVPVIMVTGNTRLDEILKARDTGISEYMAKPISVRQLYRRIEETLMRPRTFVESPDYIGPDRRRSQQPIAVERRKSQSSILEDEEIAFI